jgi:pimeloyl-ACP methyl ester carboxylesterase
VSEVLAHRVTGSGPPLLLLNGGLMTYASWEPLASALAATHTLVGCDFRGQLLSPGTPPARLEGHVADVLALLDALALPRVHVVGTSFGALVGLSLAARHPERVAALVVVTATTHVDADMWAAAQPLVAAARAALDGGDPGAVFDALLTTAFSPAFREREAEALALRRRQFAELPRAWFEGLLGLLGALEGLDLRPQLGRVRAPTLVVAAELDATFPPERSRALAAAVPGARLESVAGAGHALVAEDSPALAALVQNFIQGPAASAAASAGRAS